MLTFSKREKISQYLAQATKKKPSIGFVPTMGALHQGHISLVERAKNENDIVCCSVFVNPIQFNNIEDFEKYPVSTETDALKLEKAGCDVAFIPDKKEEVYGNEINLLKEYEFGYLDKIMEGEHRPGHFAGVANVVNRLFQIVKPTKAYFGLKDYQQYLIIKELVKKENLKISIVGCPTLRNKNGLALSSRNQRLSKKGQEDVTFIYRQLEWCRDNFQELTIKQMEQEVEDIFQEQTNLKLEYFSIVNTESLKPIKTKETEPAIACIAAWSEGVRLIDNLFLNT